MYNIFNENNINYIAIKREMMPFANDFTSCPYKVMNF